MYYTVTKHHGHLRTLEKCRKHSLAARVFYISLVFSNDHRVLPQYSTRLRLLYLLNKQHHMKVLLYSFHLNDSTDFTVRAMFYSITNKITWKYYCSIAFI